MPLPVLLAIAGGAVGELRCARDCFGSCPVYLAARDCCGPRSFCGFAAEAPVSIPVSMFKTYLQSVRADQVSVECNLNAEPYLSLGSSLSTCSLSALEISNDRDYSGPALKCDFVRRLQIGDGSLEACQAALASWGAMFGITLSPTAGPTAATAATAAATTEPTTRATRLNTSASNSTDDASAAPNKLTATHYVLISALGFCIILNVALAILLKKHKSPAPEPQNEVIADEMWDDPPAAAMSNPMYHTRAELDAEYNMAEQAMYEEPQEVMYDSATLPAADAGSNNSAC
jgi:hypothetical protein